jgi:hypothetical protein
VKKTACLKLPRQAILNVGRARTPVIAIPFAALSAIILNARL